MYQKPDLRVLRANVCLNILWVNTNVEHMLRGGCQVSKITPSLVNFNYHCVTGDINTFFKHIQNVENRIANFSAEHIVSGGHPTFEQGEVSRIVNFYWNTAAHWSSNVKIVNCGDFYVYYLPDTDVCSLAYCGH